MSPRLLTAALIFLISTSAGVYFATQLALAFPPPIQRPLSEALAINLIYYWMWGLAVPAVVWMARRVRFEKQNWVEAVVIHVAWGAVLTIAQILMAELLLRNLTEARLSAETKSIWLSVRDNFHSSMPTYLVILCGYYAFDYYAKFRDRELRASQLETRLTQSQLQALKMQLHPHFLFNTLNTISSLMYTDPEAADAMISRLSELLRLTLESEGSQEVTLREEMQMLERYLDIERVRFEERLRVHLDVEPEALEARVPNFSLQPLVENAIRHGIADRPEGGRLDIRAQRRERMLEIRLRDDGPGLSAERPEREGIGLANTRARLAQLYGADHRFEMGNAPEGGLQVTIALPFHT